jgi:hypothetical protein
MLHLLSFGVRVRGNVLAHVMAYLLVQMFGSSRAGSGLFADSCGADNGIAGIHLRHVRTILILDTILPCGMIMANLWLVSALE